MKVPSWGARVRVAAWSSVDNDEPRGPALGSLGTIGRRDRLAAIVLSSADRVQGTATAPTAVEQARESDARGHGPVDAPGHVDVHGEIWRAVSTIPLPPGAPVRVVEINGLTLVVEPVNGALAEGARGWKA